MYKIFKGTANIFFTLLIAMTLVACKDTESASNEKVEENVDEVKTIELLTFFNPDGEGGRELALKTIIDNFTEETGIKVKYNTVPWDEVDTQLILSEQAGNSPDITFVRDKEFARHMEVGSLKPLDDYINTELSDEEIEDHLNWEVGTYNESKYVFPTSYIATALYMRKDLLQEKGLEPPKTWDEFIEVGKSINSDSTSGYLFGGSPAQANQLDWLESMIVNRGGVVINENGKAAFDSQAGIESFNFLKNTIHDSEITPINVTSISYDEVTDGFAAKKTGMIIEGSHRYSTIADVLGEENIELGYIPGIDETQPSPTVISSWNLGIPKSSKHPDEAWEFIKYFISVESSLTYAKLSGEVPTLQSVMENDYFDSPEQEVIRFFADYINENSVVAVAPSTSKQLYDIVAETLQAIVLDKDSNTEEILKNATEQYNKIVE